MQNYLSWRLSRPFFGSIHAAKNSSQNMMVACNKEAGDQKGDKAGVRRQEMVFSLFPGSFACVTVDNDVDSSAADRITLLLFALSAACVAGAAYIAS